MHRTLWLIVLAMLIATAFLAGYNKDSGLTNPDSGEYSPVSWTDQEGLILDPNSGPSRGLAEDPIKHLPPPPGRSDSWYEQDEWTGVVSAEHGHFVIIPNDDGMTYIYFVRSFQNQKEGVWMTVTEAGLP